MGYLVLAIVAALIWPLSTWQNLSFNRLFAGCVQEWTVIAHWARTSTPSTAMFLLPSRIPDGAASEVSTSDLALSRTAVFEFISHRRIWVDYKRGAAVMWTPSYYRVWLTRLTEVDRLTSLEARVAYAGRNGINYVIERCNSTSLPTGVAFRTERLCVFQVGAPQRS